MKYLLIFTIPFFLGCGVVNKQAFWIGDYSDSIASKSLSPAQLMSIGKDIEAIEKGS